MGMLGRFPSPVRSVVPSLAKLAKQGKNLAQNANVTDIASPGGTVAMRVYLVVIDESEEALTALRFAARRAARTNGTVHLLAVVAPQPFNAFAGVQATIEEEARSRAEALATSAAGSLVSESGRMPVISVIQGEAEKIVRDYLAEHPEVSALVLGAAREGGPGPLVQHFTGHLSHLPCPLFVIPGSLSADDIDRVS
jgi:nucleotide-binding universal stress UspA family protein